MTWQNFYEYQLKKDPNTMIHYRVHNGRAIILEIWCGMADDCVEVSKSIREGAKSLYKSIKEEVQDHVDYELCEEHWEAM